MNIGQRVRVNIRDRQHYTFGCADKLDKATGTVERYKARSSNGRNFDGPAALVTFDMPRETWWSGQSEVTAFWFPVEDLELQP